MNEIQIEKEMKRKASIREYADSCMKGKINCDSSFEKKVMNALDSTVMQPIQMFEVGGEGKAKIWRKVQKRYLNFMWSWYFDKVFSRQTRYNKELVDIIQMLNKKIEEQKEIIENLEKKLDNSMDAL